MAKKLIGVAGVLLLIVVGVGVWYFVIRDDSVEKDTVGCDPEPCEASTVESIDGTWAIVADESDTSLVISETIGGVADHQVEGNTAIDGTVTIADGSVTTAELTADMTTLEFTDSPPGFDVANRANAMQNQGLEISAFPEATFVLTSPIALPDDVESGQEVTSSATGDLTLHGVTKEITFDVTVVADGERFKVTPTDFIPIALADYDMSVQAPGFVADIGDEGSFDFVLTLEQQ
jgi:polyisoprenoid-binding protein YceI